MTPIHQLTLPDALRLVGSRREGLEGGEAAQRLAAARQKHGLPQSGSLMRAAMLFLNQFRSPLVLLLLGAMALSFALGAHEDALIVLAVVLMSTLMGFWQEHSAANAVAALLARVQTKSAVLRDGREIELPLAEIVPGDVVLLNAGDTIPGDGLLLESKDLFVDESALTGESYPAEKRVGEVPADTPQPARFNAVYEGTHVVSGTARMLVMLTGKDTEFGTVSQRLRLRAPETDFERGLRRFGEMLIRVTLMLVIVLFGMSVVSHRPPLQSFMFVLALAVGMTPELLPAVVSITLARGAQRMARQQVIVRRLPAIENFGSMNVLCSDKTGTLTEGRVRLHAALNAEGLPDAGVLLHAVLNAAFESGFANPIDEALRGERPPGMEQFSKFDEVPYDFIRKRLSVVVETQHGTAGSRHLMITKGAFANVLAVCARVARPAGPAPLDSAQRAALQDSFARHSSDGLRVLGVAVRDVTGDPVITKDDEQDMTFSGFLLFDDPPKEGAAAAIAELRALGIRLKVITGDNRLVAGRLASHIGVAEADILTGAEMRQMSDAALLSRVGQVDIFAETEPNQKERILTALRKAGNVVGFLGDGINDASALHAADVGISVDGAVDVAKEAADIVLLRHDLGVLAQGVRNGRMTFANTLKYIFITTSANFGNMVSMACASLFLPFLPLLPKQILLNNLLSDLPALTIATDTVDAEQLQAPRRWDQRMIRSFMVSFGLVSSAFDLLTFGLLALWLRASEARFQTAWFIESLLTELFIVMVIRTHRPFLRSRPGRLLLWATLGVTVLTLALPCTRLGALFGLVPLPLSWMLLLTGIVAAYLLVNEWIKSLLFARMDQRGRRPAAG